jgi:hypothetical protein
MRLRLIDDAPQENYASERLPDLSEESGGRCEFHVATEWSVSSQRRNLYLERYQSIECCKQCYQLLIRAPDRESVFAQLKRRGNGESWRK